MDKKALSNLAIVLAVVSMASYFSSMFPLMITAVGALAISIFAVKEKETTAKVLDPIVTVSCISLTHLIFTVIQNISNSIINLSENVNYKVVNNLSETFRIISLIFTFIMIVAIVIAIIFTSMGKRIPVASKISDKILNICEKKTKKEEKSENPKTEEKDA